VALSGSPVMYFQFSTQHMWRIGTHLHTEVILVQIRDGKTGGSGSYSGPTGKTTQKQRVNLLFIWNSNQLMFLP